jgi:ATP-dependent Lon protease
MYCIQTAGYDVAQKVVIAKQYLLPKIRAQVNFREGDVVIPDEVLRYIISNERITQKEDGVRNLKRCLEIIHTKLNLFRLIHTETPNVDTKIVQKDEAKPVVTDPKVVLKDEANWFLGKDMPLNVSFPHTVTSKEVDILIRHDEKQNHSLLSMYV